jgi:hypothetical protein
MRDLLEERLASRLQALGETVHDELPPPADLELRVARRRRRTRANRRWSSLAVAAAIVAAVASVALVQGTAGTGPVLHISTAPTSVAPPVHDALQPGTVMLSARGHFVISLDEAGHQNATMVAVKDGNITYARSTDDHRTIWYLSLKHGTAACGDVVRANIDGNSSKIVAQAVAFDVSRDGTRLALYGAGNLADGKCAPVKSGTTGEIAVVDVATFESSTLPIGGVTSLRFAPDGSYLVAASCSAHRCEEARRIDVPSPLGASLVSEPMSFAAKVTSPVRATSVAFGGGAMFVLEPSPSDTIYRYDPTRVGPAPAVFVGAREWDVTQLVPTATGIDVVAARMPPGGEPGASSFGLYRVEAGRLVLVRLLVAPGTLTDVRPLPRG